MYAYMECMDMISARERLDSIENYAFPNMKKNGSDKLLKKLKSRAASRHKGRQLTMSEFYSKMDEENG